MCNLIARCSAIDSSFKASRVHYATAAVAPETKSAGFSIDIS